MESGQRGRPARGTSPELDAYTKELSAIVQEGGTPTDAQWLKAANLALLSSLGSNRPTVRIAAAKMLLEMARTKEPDAPEPEPLHDDLDAAERSLNKGEPHGRKKDGGKAAEVTPREGRPEGVGP